MLCHNTHVCSALVFQGGEPDLKTAAKMVLHDWVRGRIPFFIPPPQAEKPKVEEAKPAPAVVETPGGEVQPETDEQKAAKVAAAAIAEVVSKQRIRKVPVKENFFDVEDAHPDGVLLESEEEEDEDMDGEGVAEEEDDDDKAGVAPGGFASDVQT